MTMSVLEPSGKATHDQDRFFGGGSVQWSPKIVTDIALCEPLADAQLVLHDIDADALGLLTQACERIVAQVDGSLKVTPTLDRAETLRDADFVILCVAIGALEAVRNDLEIPERYGIYQPGGGTRWDLAGWRAGCATSLLLCRWPARWSNCVLTPGCSM